MAANLAAILLSCSSSFSHRLSGVTRREERTLATGGSSGATGTLVGDLSFSGTCQGEVPLLPCVANDAAEQVVIPAPGWLNEARGAAADDRAERRRIAGAIEQARRAQAGLLLANLGAENALQANSGKERPPIQENQPFRNHPYLLPRGAPAQLISRAMEQALAKYQATRQQQR